MYRLEYFIFFGLLIITLLLDCAVYRRYVRELFIFVSAILPRLISDFVLLCTDDTDVCLTESVSLLSAVASVTIGVGDMLRSPPLYSVNEYISQYVPPLDARWFSMLPVGATLTVKVGNKEREKAYAAWRRRWNIGPRTSI